VCLSFIIYQKTLRHVLSLFQHAANIHPPL